MKEYTSPGAVPVAADDNCVEALWERERRQPRAPALAFRRGDVFVEITTADFAGKVRRLAAGLMALGLEPGTRVAIYSPSRVEFTELDYAVWAAGCATVTVYESSSAEQVEWIVGNSEAQAIVCATAELKRRFDEVAGNLPSCQHVFVIDDGGLDQLREAGVEVSDDQVAERSAGISHDDLATLVYTSGTTGRPKGCELTHGNLIWDVRQVVAAAPDLFTPGDRTLMFLPLAHILARLVQIACVTQGVTIGYSTGIPHLVEEMGLFPPSFVVAVPRVFEKVFNTAQGQASGIKGTIFERAVVVAIDYSKQKRAGQVSWATKAQHALFDRLVYGKLRAAFGGELEFAISGGAPLGERLGHFFDGAGVLVLEGYGLTETTGAATLNTPQSLQIGSVGRPIPGASAAIDDDGEVLLKGGHVFRGYWRNPEATAEDLEADGWFHTGDIGEIDGEGFLRITGRKKDLIVTAGGKNVAPAVLEDRLRAHALVSQAVVVGDARPFIGVVITLDAEELPAWAEAHQKPSRPPEELAAELADDPELLAEIETAVEDANQAVSRAESIREFRVLERDFSVEGGELTPTLKVKRNVVLERCAATIDDMYGD